jgi:hypothetical protein
MHRPRNSTMRASSTTTDRLRNRKHHTHQPTDFLFCSQRTRQDTTTYDVYMAFSLSLYHSQHIFRTATKTSRQDRTRLIPPCLSASFDCFRMRALASDWTLDSVAKQNHIPYFPLYFSLRTGGDASLGGWRTFDLTRVVAVGCVVRSLWQLVRCTCWAY